MFLRGTIASRESVRRWFHRFSKIFSVEGRFRDAVAVDETVVKMHGLRAYVWSAVDVVSGEILAIYASWSRNILIAMKFLRTVLDRCLNKPLIVVDRRLCNSNSNNQKPNHSDKNPRRRITWLTGS